MRSNHCLGPLGGERDSPCPCRVTLFKVWSPQNFCWGKHLLCCSGGKFAWIHCISFLRNLPNFSPQGHLQSREEGNSPFCLLSPTFSSLFLCPTVSEPYAAPLPDRLHLKSQSDPSDHSESREEQTAKPQSCFLERPNFARSSLGASGGEGNTRCEHSIYRLRDPSGMREEIGRTESAVTSARLCL